MFICTQDIYQDESTKFLVLFCLNAYVDFGRVFDENFYKTI